MLVSDNGASAEGGCTGTTNEAQFFNNAPEPLEESLQLDRRARRPGHVQPLPVGLDLGGQHAVPPVEAGDLPGRRRATRSSCTGPPGSRPAARCAPSTRTSSTSCRPCWTLLGAGAARDDPGRHPVTAPRGQLRADVRRRGRREPPHHPVLRDARPPGHRPRRLAGGLPVAGPSFAEAGQGFGVPITAEDAHRPGRHRWELYHIARGPDREPQRGRTASRPAHRDDRQVVRRGGQVRRDAHRRQRAGAADGRTAAGGACRATATCTARTRRRSGLVSPRLLNRPHSITADVDQSRGWGPGGAGRRGRCCSARAPARAGGSCSCSGRRAALRAQLRAAGPCTRWPRVDPRAARAARAALRVRAHRGAGLHGGQGRPGPGPALRGRPPGGQAEFPVTTPIGLNPGGLTCGANPGSPVAPDYRSPFRFTGTLHTVTVDLSGDLISDTEGEMRMAMMRQ